MTLPHGPVNLPMFMPVATQASLKGLTPEQLENTGCRLCLNNTYHLGLKPGQEVLDAVGGAHKFQGWNHNILTDSGGYVFKPGIQNADRRLLTQIASRWSLCSSLLPSQKKVSVFCRPMTEPPCCSRLSTPSASRTQ